VKILIALLLCSLLTGCLTFATPTKLFAAGGKGRYEGKEFSVVWNNEKSFRDFMMMLGVAVMGWSQAAINEAKEVSARYAAGQITKREAAAHIAAIQQSQIKAGLVGEAIKAGAPVTVAPITPP
jgi:hypothetical protein